MRWWGWFVAAALSGGLIGLAWRYESLGWMGVVGLGVFLATQICSQRRLLTRCFESWLTGFVAFAIACAWLPFTTSYLAQTNAWVGFGIAILFWLYLGSQYACFVLVMGGLERISKTAFVAAPVVWVSLERVYPGLFPSSAACLLTGCNALAQIAEFGGVHLVSLFTVTLAGFAGWTGTMLVRMLRRPTVNKKLIAKWGVCFALLLLVNGWGAMRVRQINRELVESVPANSLRVGLVQVDTQFNVSHARLLEASRAMDAKVDLIVWPEASLGDYSSSLRDFRDQNTVFEGSRGDDTRYQPFPNPNAVLLAGGDSWTEVSGTLNSVNNVSAFLIDTNEQLIGRRHKVKLMPFGERIPLRDLFPVLQKWIGGERIISQGVSNRPIGVVAGVSIGALLCCEDMHPELVRSLVNDGAEVLVTLGNGMVFQSETALQQHFRIAKFRAIENRIPFIRCTSSGVSGVWSASGDVIYQLPTGIDAAAVVTLKVNPRHQTCYSKYGNLLPNLLMIGLLGFAVSGVERFSFIRRVCRTQAELQN